MDSKAINELCDAAHLLGVSLSQLQCEKLGTFIGLLEEWNQVYNLTAISDLNAHERVHLLDSLSVGPHLEGLNFVDVGTGGGLPGIPLSIAYPNTQWVLLDKSQKKIRFLNHVIMTLKLGDRVQAFHTRVENFQRELLFDGAICRAFSSLPDFIDGTRHLVKEGGYFYAMKGIWDPSHPEHQPVASQVETIIPLKVPGFWHRHLVVLRRSKTS